MLIKQQMLARQVDNKIAPLYVLSGQDNYLLDESLAIIKSAIKQRYEYDEKIVSIQNPADWNTLIEEANSYSLFFDTVLINLFYDKKSIDAAGKKALTHYLSAINPKCFIIIRAPNVPAKQLQWLSAHTDVVVSVAYPLNALAMKTWISTQLKNNAIHFDPAVPEIIQHYTQGNMLACAQAIEKIILCNGTNSTISIAQVQEHLSDQCEYELFELVEACLSGQSDKVIQIVRHAAQNKTEPTLVLWILTQEIRVLIQIATLLQQGMDIRNACTQLKVWTQRVAFYQKCCARFSLPQIAGIKTLYRLHQQCYFIDECIKSSFSTQVWNSLESLSLSLSLGRLTGDACTV